MENDKAISNNTFMVIIIIVGLLIGSAIALWLLPADEADIVPEPVQEIAQPIEEPVVEVPEIEPEVVEESLPVIEPEPIEEEPVVEPIPLPTLNESDEAIQEKLETMTWRKELLKLVIDEDMVRRFVVFTDNFANGNIVYEHSPLVKPESNFTATEVEQGLYVWNEDSTKRYTLYLELLQSFDSEQLVNWYFEIKPLIDEAYAELGYTDTDFTDTLRVAIDRVLDTNVPDGSANLVRPSVMFKYEDEQLEALPAADKLLMRIGKSNVLVLKSLLLKIDDKLSQE